MPRYKMVVYSKGKAGREKEYDEWYDKIHLGEITSIKGIKSGQRYTLKVNLTQTPGVMSNLTIYDIDTPDLNLVLQELGKGPATPSDSLDIASASLSIYEESGAMVYHKG